MISEKVHSFTKIWCWTLTVLFIDFANLVLTCVEIRVSQSLTSSMKAKNDITTSIFVKLVRTNDSDSGFSL